MKKILFLVARLSVANYSQAQKLKDKLKAKMDEFSGDSAPSSKPSSSSSEGIVSLDFAAAKWKDSHD